MNNQLTRRYSRVRDDERMFIEIPYTQRYEKMRFNYGFLAAACLSILLWGAVLILGYDGYQMGKFLCGRFVEFLGGVFR